MLYSVWDPAARRYNYFTAPGDDSVPPPAPPIHGRIAAQNAAWPLPKNAIQMGSGPVAKGMIASQHSTGMGDAVTNSLATVAAIAVIIYMAGKL